MSIIRIIAVGIAVLLASSCNGQATDSETIETDISQSSERYAHYLGNAGVMISDGETKLLFDPLFEQNFHIYQKVPASLQAKMLSGEAPYDGVDVLLISHAHGDHFSADMILAYMSANPLVKLVAPKQAVDKLLKVGLSKTDMTTRVTSIDQQIADKPIIVQIGSITIEAITIPHSGGQRFADVRNTVYRVHLQNQYQVIHLGDATIENPPFAEQQEFWDEQSNELLLTPYWLFKNPQRQANIDTHIRPHRSIGIHVPTALHELKKRYGSALDEVDLFTKPGEERSLDSIENENQEK